MDAANRFETESNFLLWRLEYLLLLVVCLGALVYQWESIRLIPFLILFSYIDLIGYIPGAIVYRLNKGRVPPLFYHLYNGTHNFISAALVALAWCLLVKPEWALLAIPIHLFGDRAIFGNSFKDARLNYEGSKHRDFEDFERKFSLSERFKQHEEPGATDPKVRATTVSQEKHPASAMLMERFADHPSAFLSHNEETSHFSVPDLEGFIPYIDDGRCLFMICGVFAAPHRRQKLLDSFVQAGLSQKRRLCCVQVRDDQVALFERSGFSVNQMGLSYSTDISHFKTAGSAFMSTRNKIKRARKAGVTVLEAGKDIPMDESLSRKIDDITREWLVTKGNKKLLKFMVGELSKNTMDSRRIFCAFMDEKIVGFVSYVPSYGTFDGWMHDLSRRARGAPPGVMELINITALERFRDEGVKFLNFGLTPFCGISQTHDNHPTRSRFVSWLFRKLEIHGQKIYPAMSQVAYKRKWQPMIETPEYVAFYRGFRWGHLYRLLKITQSI